MGHTNKDKETRTQQSLYMFMATTVPYFEEKDSEDTYLACGPFVSTKPIRKECARNPQDVSLNEANLFRKVRVNTCQYTRLHRETRFLMLVSNNF